MGTREYQFLAGPRPNCFDAADSDDTGSIDLSDAVYILNFLFLSGPALPEPRVCGADPQPDGLERCESESC